MIINRRQASAESPRNGSGDTSMTEQNSQPLVAGAVKVLDRLSLSGEELQALSQQGFVNRERRGGIKSIYKLRFRFRGRQIVKYIGPDPALAASIRDAVASLQRPRMLVDELHRVDNEAQALLRRTKRDLQAMLAAAGLRFHGYALRRTRKQSQK